MPLWATVVVPREYVMASGTGRVMRPAPATVSSSTSRIASSNAAADRSGLPARKAPDTALDPSESATAPHIPWMPKGPKVRIAANNGLSSATASRATMARSAAGGGVLPSAEALGGSSMGRPEDAAAQVRRGETPA